MDAPNGGLPLRGTWSRKTRKGKDILTTDFRYDTDGESERKFETKFHDKVLNWGRRDVVLTDYSKWMTSWSQRMASVPVKSSMPARRSTARDVVVFTVAVWGPMLKSWPPLSGVIERLPTTVPEVPAVRTVIRERT